MTGGIPLAMSSAAYEMWNRVHDEFDPAVPAPADVRVERQYNPVSERIAPRLQRVRAFQRFVLAGGVGSGKSTELLAATTLVGSKVVVFFDFWRHFQAKVTDPNALDHLKPAELVALLGLAVLRVGSEALGHRGGGLDVRFQAAVAGLQEGAGPASVDVGKLASSLALVVGGQIGAIVAGPVGAAAGPVAQAAVQASVKVLEASKDAWSWRIGMRGPRTTTDQDAPVRAVVEATNALLDDLRREGRSVVLLVDGLDRVQRAEGFVDLFVESALLAELRCDLVVTLVLGLAQRHRNQLRWCTAAYDFTSVPVADFTDPFAPSARGIAFFRALARRRFEKLGLVPPISDLHLGQLAYASGGRLRDFVTLVREVAVGLMIRDTVPSSADDGVVADAIESLRRSHEAGLNTGHIEVLRAVLDDSHHHLPDGEVALDLLQRQLLLAYPNEHTWYLPHTQLLRLVSGRVASS